MGAIWHKGEQYGGGGVSAYSELEGLPSINGHILLGEQSFEDLGLQDALTAGDGIDINESTISIDEMPEEDFDDILIGLPAIYPDGSRQQGFTPVGTIIAVMGKSAPPNYLACNGQTENIATYPELAAYFKEQFGSEDYFGGDGTTTFGIPDLRGEFLRGVGTNGHSGQGSGGIEAGIHQDGTGHVAIGYSYEGSQDYISFPHAGTSTWAGYRLADSTFGGGTNAYIAKSGSNDNARISYYTSRPTNTSVLYCIAVRNIYAGVYKKFSLDEQVIGEWIDGKPLYQKTLTGKSPTTADTATTIIQLPDDVDKVTFLDGYILPSTKTYYAPLVYIQGSAYISTWIRYKNHSSSGGKNVIAMQVSSTYINHDVAITVQYTKTTDIARY